MEFICIKQVPGSVGGLFPVGTIVNAEPDSQYPDMMSYDDVTLSKETFLKCFTSWDGSEIVKGFEPTATEEETKRAIEIMADNEEIKKAVLEVSKTGYEGMKQKCKQICLRIIAENIDL